MLTIIDKFSKAPFPGPGSPPPQPGPGGPGPDSPNPNPQPGPNGPNSPSSGAYGWLDDVGMEIIAKEHNLKETSDLEMITAGISQTIKLGTNPGIDKAHYKNKKIIFLPVNNSSNSTLSGSGGHWALLAYDVDNQSFHYYDSSGSGNWTHGQTLAKKFGQILEGREDLPIKAEAAAQQSDGQSCGVFTMANIKFLTQRYNNKGSSPMSWGMDASEKQVVINTVGEMWKLLKNKGWSDTGTGANLTEFDTWSYSEEHEHAETIRLLLNGVSGLNSFQQYIKGKFTDNIKADKLIRLGNKANIDKINFGNYILFYTKLGK